MADTTLTGMAAAVADLKQRREKAKRMGGQEAVDKQHAAGKLTARERLDLLFDPRTFEEWGLHANHQSQAAEMQGRDTPADGVITGVGKVNGRLVAVIAYDFTVMAGTIGMIGEAKANRIRETAMRQGIPIVWLLDSAGARVHEIAGSQFAGSGKLFHDQSLMSGVVPQVAAMMGHCAAGTAYIPALADFVPMVKGTSSMALAGPPLVKAAIGETVSVEELGGSRVHCEVSGVADLEVGSDEACIQAIKDYLSYFPDNCRQTPPMRPAVEPPLRSDEELLRILPEQPKLPYDMKAVLSRIVDDGRYFELKPRFAQSIITALARIGGRSVGIVASQPKVMGGVLTTDAADKAARFISLCDAFNLPLIFFQDVPGFMVGSKVEKEGIIRHGAKMLYAVSNATVPKLTVIVRKAYGAGYYVMCGRAYGPDLIVAWPGAEISLMGPEGAVNIIGRKQIDGAADPDAERTRLVDQFKDYINPYIAAGSALIDDVIDPRETRRVLMRGLELASQKHVRQPERKHGVMPV